MYGVLLYIHLGNLRILENAIRSVVRLVTRNAKIRQKALTICDNLKWFFPEELGVYKMLCLVYKMLNIIPIEYFQNYYKLNENIHNHRTRDSKKITVNFVPRSNHPFGLSPMEFVTSGNKT